jgi:hypothetical protein
MTPSRLRWMCIRQRSRWPCGVRAVTGDVGPSTNLSGLPTNQAVGFVPSRPFTRDNRQESSQVPRVLPRFSKERPSATCVKGYSYLSATMGSTRIARRAGI